MISHEERSFHQFPNLPYELRRKVWGFAIEANLATLEPVVISVDSVIKSFNERVYLIHRIFWFQGPYPRMRNVRYRILNHYFKVCHETRELAILHGIVPLLASKVDLGVMYFNANIDTIAMIWTCTGEPRLDGGFQHITPSAISAVRSLQVCIDLGDPEDAATFIKTVLDNYRRNGESAFASPEYQKYVTLHPFENVKKVEFCLVETWHSRRIDWYGRGMLEHLGQSAAMSKREFMKIFTKQFFQNTYAGSSVPEITFGDFNEQNFQTRTL